MPNNIARPVIIICMLACIAMMVLCCKSKEGIYHVVSDEPIGPYHISDALTEYQLPWPSEDREVLKLKPDTVCEHVYVPVMSDVDNLDQEQIDNIMYNSLDTTENVSWPFMFCICIYCKENSICY